MAKEADLRLALQKNFERIDEIEELDPNVT
jgi:hypothetical protein